MRRRRRAANRSEGSKKHRSNIVIYDNMNEWPIKTFSVSIFICWYYEHVYSIDMLLESVLMNFAPIWKSGWDNVISHWPTLFFWLVACARVLSHSVLLVRILNLLLRYESKVNLWKRGRGRGVEGERERGRWRGGEWEGEREGGEGEGDRERERESGRELGDVQSRVACCV